MVRQRNPIRPSSPGARTLNSVNTRINYGLKSISARKLEIDSSYNRQFLRRGIDQVTRSHRPNERFRSKCRIDGARYNAIMHTGTRVRTLCRSVLHTVETVVRESVTAATTARPTSRVMSKETLDIARPSKFRQTKARDNGPPLS